MVLCWYIIILVAENLVWSWGTSPAEAEDHRMDIRNGSVWLIMVHNGKTTTNNGWIMDNWNVPSVHSTQLWKMAHFKKTSHWFIDFIVGWKGHLVKGQIASASWWLRNAADGWKQHPGHLSMTLQEDLFGATSRPNFFWLKLKKDYSHPGVIPK